MNFLEGGLNRFFFKVDLLNSLQLNKAFILCPDDEMRDFIIEDKIVVLGKDNDTVKAVVFPTKMPSMILAMLNSIIKGTINF